MHLLIRKEDIDLVPGPPATSAGPRRALLIGGHTGATHTGLSLIELSNGHVDLHLHSFETSFYVLEGEPILYLEGAAVTLKPGACGAIPVGARHAWRSQDTARWIEMASPLSAQTRLTWPCAQSWCLIALSTRLRSTRSRGARSVVSTGHAPSTVTAMPPPWGTAFRMIAASAAVSTVSRASTLRPMLE